MLLPDLLPNNTRRFWLKYTAFGVKHDICFRMPTGTTVADGVQNAQDLATALAPLMATTDSFQSLRYSEAGSNLSFPIAFLPVTGTLSYTGKKDDKAEYLAVAGRSLGGYRCRLTFFCGGYNEDNGFRVAAQTALLIAANAAEPAFAAIDGLEVIWNGYTNRGYNAYWQRKLRTV